MATEDHRTGGTHEGERESHASHPVGRPQQRLSGLASSGLGLRMEAEPVIVSTGKDVPFEFRVVRERDGPVTSFDELHERRMHLIVLRRDLTGFQHPHPKMDDSGTWRTNLRLPSGGAWRAFADFSTEGTPTTLGGDLLVEGEFKPEPVPAPTATATVGDHVVSLERDDAAGTLRFTVTRAGSSVEVDPYLGAKGHLVAVRWGDLACSSRSSRRRGHRLCGDVSLRRYIPPVPPVPCRRCGSNGDVHGRRELSRRRRLLPTRSVTAAMPGAWSMPSCGHVVIDAPDST